MEKRYLDRNEAGKALAQLLIHYIHRQNTIILALPRGGVPLAYEVAHALDLPFYPFLVRKLGAPGNNELAMGAVAMGGITVFNQSILSSLRITQDEIDQVLAKEQHEIARREKIYFAQKKLPSLRDKCIILIDDGIATGATMKVAITALRQAGVKSIIVSVPVCPASIVVEFKTIADEFICPMIIENFSAVGDWYESFPAVEESTAITMIQDSI